MTRPLATLELFKPGLSEVDQILAGHHERAERAGSDAFAFTCARRRTEVLCWGAFPDREPYMNVDHLTPTRITF